MLLDESWCNTYNLRKTSFNFISVVESKLIAEAKGISLFVYIFSSKHF